MSVPNTGHLGRIIINTKLQNSGHPSSRSSDTVSSTKDKFKMFQQKEHREITLHISATYSSWLQKLVVVVDVHSQDQLMIFLHFFFSIGYFLLLKCLGALIGNHTGLDSHQHRGVRDMKRKTTPGHASTNERVTLLSSVHMHLFLSCLNYEAV